LKKMDFTISRYYSLLRTLQSQGFSFLPFHEFISKTAVKTIVLRHDVDALPLNSLKFAKIQADMGLRGSYYFRVAKGSWDEDVIKKIADLGHEVGYHYEDLSLVAKRQKAKGGRQRGGSMVRRYDGMKEEEGLRDEGNKRGRDLGLKGEEFEKELVDIAIESFSKNLEKLRKITPVKTICMHGSPMSKWDSRLLWKYYDYKDFGVVGEPYFDVNFDDMLYLTDTGRRWDGDSVSIRDKVQDAGRMTMGEDPFKDWKVKPFKYKDKTLIHNSNQPTPSPQPKRGRHSQEGNQQPATCNLHPASFPKFHSTSDIIRTAENGQLPDKIMMTFHPQRWTDKPFPWVKELVWQNVKNVVKYFLIKVNS
jgi:hypothetical protein